MRRLFKGAIYFKISFVKLLTTITINHTGGYYML